jgi:PAS domain S-box-containing protein
MCTNEDGGRADEPEPPDGGRTPEIEERYRKIFQHNNDAVMIVDLEAEEFVDVNPRACELLGYSRSELLSMEPDDIHPDDIDRVREEFISQVVEEGSGFTDDLTCLTKNGREIPTEISGAALEPTPDGREPDRMIAMLRDISDRVRRRRELEAKVERLDRFASIISHDLRNPLSVIQGHVGLARETGDPEHFDAIEDAADRMEEMLSELLRLTREGNLVGERTSVELAEVARAAWEGCTTERAALTVESSRTIDGDRDRLYELFANLFENAVEHGSTGSRTESDDAVDHGGPSVAVRVGTLEPERRGFYVADDGAGIPVDDRETVFEWGQTTTQDGTGFGLAIVADIAEAHGWEISVRDAAQGGARFEIRTD